MMLLTLKHTESSYNRRRRKSKKKCKVDVVTAQPLNSHAPLRISKLTNGISVAGLPPAQAIFRDKYEVIPIFDDKDDEPQIVDQEIEEFFDEVTNLQPKRRRGGQKKKFNPSIKSKYHIKSTSKYEHSETFNDGAS
ncbi:hypothetical protein LguiA_023886 [Lonicera macranthoides]